LWLQLLYYYDLHIAALAKSLMKGLVIICNFFFCSLQRKYYNNKQKYRIRIESNNKKTAFAVRLQQPIFASQIFYLDPINRGVCIIEAGLLADS
jgi:hypothetical protein